MLKETTASEIFRRLNSYSQQHALYRALKAFGRIIKSTFILRYIDEVELRKAIERQLNKMSMRTALQGLSRWATRASFSRQKSRNRRSLRAANGSSKIAYVLELSLFVAKVG
jgi:TnpA family transposase